MPTNISTEPRETSNQQLLASKPRWRTDAFCVPVNDSGVTALSSLGQLTLRGAALARALQKLGAFLDGQHSLQALTRSLPAAQREKVIELIEWLYRHGLLEPAAPAAETAAEASLPEPARHLAQHLGAQRLTALDRFQRYQAGRMLVLCPGAVVAELLRALIDSGSGHITVGTTDGQQPCARELAALRSEGAATIELPSTSDGGVQSRLVPLIRAADFVLQLSAERELTELVEEHCAREGKVLCRAWLDGRQAWLLPQRDGELAGARSLWLRLGGDAAAMPLTSEAADSARPVPGGAGLALHAQRLALRTLRQVAGLDMPSAARIECFDLAELTTSQHRLDAHPLAQPRQRKTRAELVAQVQALEQAPATTDAEFSRAARRCIDARVGLLRELDELHFEQVPLWVAQARVSDPVGLLAARGAPRVVHGAALDFAAARARAARQGLELYAAGLLDERSVVRADAVAGTGVSGGADEPQVWGWRLDGGGAQLLPLRVALAWEQPAAALPSGLASGASWSAALDAGLASCCQALVVAEALSSSAVHGAIDLDAAPLDPAGRRLLHLLRLSGAQAQAYSLNAPPSLGAALGLPTVALYLAQQPVVYVTRWTLADALRDALEQALLAQQATLTGQHELAPPAVAPLPRISSTFSPAASLVQAADREAVLRALAARQQLPIALPLDQDSALAVVLPYAVRVVLMGTGADAG